ncbi:MAG: (2Fe-2S)-binding protein [Youngiibacter sp.]|nr:(2Fe-2S)-binding protein [Youngiibacter sp.]
MNFSIGSSLGIGVGKAKDINGSCPVCGNEGISVGAFIVGHLVEDEYRNLVLGERYRICMDENCDVVYFNSEDQISFRKNQVRVPIWFKSGADPKYACYCSKVTEAQVIEAVLNGARTVAEVNAATGAMKNSNCRENNPLGVCCHKIIQEVIDRNRSHK